MIVFLNTSSHYEFYNNQEGINSIYFVLYNQEEGEKQTDKFLLKKITCTNPVLPNLHIMHVVP